MINDWLPPTFLSLALAHGVALLSPGPDFFCSQAMQFAIGFAAAPLYA